MANELIVQITSQADFQDKVLKASGAVLVDFWAPWCGPCRMVAPVLDQIAGEQAGALTICKVNVDELGQLAANYGVMSIPTMLLFKGGQVVDTQVGAVPKAMLDGFIKQAL